MSTSSTSLLESLQHLNAQELRRLLVEHLTQQKVGLYWESNAIARDAALNADVVLPRLRPDISHTPAGTQQHRNLIIEGDNFDSLRRTNALEHHTELVTGVNYDEAIEVVIDRSALARQAMAVLRQLPQAEEEDYKIIVQVLAERLRSHLDAALADEPEEPQPTDMERKRLARDAAHWVICKEAQPLREDMFSEIALRAQLVDAQPLPDVMVFPAGIALETSRKNIYGVLPPSHEAGERVGQVLFMDDRQWLADTTYRLTGGDFVQGQFDGTWFGNSLEDAFSRALDRTEFVEWWHRNPRNKPYAVRVVRAEHDNYFYPDFVVCVRHSPGEAPVQRLLETKDAARKAKHWPAGYGKVMFLTPDGNRMRWVNDDGSLGEVLDFENLQAALGHLQATRPEAL